MKSYYARDSAGRQVTVVKDKDGKPRFLMATLKKVEDGLSYVADEDRGIPIYDEDKNIIAFQTKGGVYDIENLTNLKPVPNTIPSVYNRNQNHITCTSTYTLRWEGKELVTQDIDIANAKQEWLFERDIPFSHTIHRETNY